MKTEIFIFALEFWSNNEGSVTVVYSGVWTGRSCQAASTQVKVSCPSKTFRRNLCDVCGYDCDNETVFLSITEHLIGDLKVILCNKYCLLSPFRWFSHACRDFDAIQVTSTPQPNSSLCSTIYIYIFFF